MTQFDEQRAETLYQSGKTFQEISDLMGVSRTAIWRRFRKRGIERRPAVKRGAAPLNVPEIRHLYFDKRMSLLGIAQTLTVPYNRVRDCLIQADIPRKPKKPYKGTASAKWRGGLCLNTNTGYVHRTVNGQQVMEHRYVMEQHLGRALTAEEVVHHKDRDKTNNRIENLQLLPNAAAHNALHRLEDARKTPARERLTSQGSR